MSKSYNIQANAASAGLGVGSRKAANTGGALVNMHYVDTFADPIVASTNNATSLIVTTVAADAGEVALTIATQPDYPRNLAISADAAQTENVTIVGTDQFGVAQTEVIAFNGAAVVAGTKVFKTITSITQAARAPGAANIAVGVGSIIGTSRRMNGLNIDGAVFTTASGYLTAVQEATRPVKAPTAAVYGVTFNTAIAATKTYCIAYGSDEMR